jgi:hypothetical protein
MSQAAPVGCEPVNAKTLPIANIQSSQKQKGLQDLFRYIFVRLKYISAE